MLWIFFWFCEVFIFVNCEFVGSLMGMFFLFATTAVLSSACVWSRLRVIFIILRVDIGIKIICVWLWDVMVLKVVLIVLWVLFVCILIRLSMTRLSMSRRRSVFVINLVAAMFICKVIFLLFFLVFIVVLLVLMLIVVSVFVCWMMMWVLESFGLRKMCSVFIIVSIILSISSVLNIGLVFWCNIMWFIIFCEVFVWSKLFMMVLYDFLVFMVSFVTRLSNKSRTRICSRDAVCNKCWGGGGFSVNLVCCIVCLDFLMIVF